MYTWAGAGLHTFGHILRAELIVHKFDEQACFANLPIAAESGQAK